MIKRYARTFLFLAAVAGCAFAVHKVAASQGAKPRRARVEHCAVVLGQWYIGEDGKTYGQASICNFFSSESRCETARFPHVAVKGDAQPDAVKMQTAASVISRLGSEGWELVGEGKAGAVSGSDAEALYFKRVVE